MTATLASTVAPAQRQPQPQPQPYNTLQQLPLPSGILRECINTGLLTDLSGNPQYKEYSESLTQLFADMCSYVYEKFSATTSISSANDIDGFFAYWINVGGDDLGNKISAREDVLKQCANGKYCSILDHKPKGSTTGIPCKNSDDSMVVWPLSKPSPSLAPYAAIFGKSPVPATPSAQFLNDKEITIKLNGGIVKERLGALDRNTSDDNSLRAVITDILIRVRSVESDSIFSFSRKKEQFQNLIEVICNESNRDAWYEHLYAAANGDQCSDYNYSSLGYSFTGGILFNGLMENAIIRCLALVIDFRERMSPVQTGSHKCT